MSERDEGPSSPAGATLLRPPSEAAVELEVRAAEAAVEAEETAEEKRVADEAARAKAAAAEAEAKEAAGRAPGFFRSVRFLGLVLAAALGAIVGLGNGEDGFIPWSVSAAFGAVWLLLLGVFAVDAATWRRKLPFALVGFDRIGGDNDSREDYAPWIGFRVQIVMTKDRSRVARAARKRTLEILVARANLLLEKDKDFKRTDENEWRIDDDTCLGQGSQALYTRRVIERWLRKDVPLLVKQFPVEKVVVNARYTGKSQLLS